ncbi:hypothetical protein Tco_0474170 [Tanacetum coccineum]
MRALHPKWRAKVTAIEESKDLTSPSLDEVIGNLKVHEMIIKKDFKIVKAKVKRKSLALNARKESSDEECSTSGSEDEEYAMAVRDFKKCGDPNHLIGECPKPPKDKNQKSFVGGSWSDSGEEDDEKVKNKTLPMEYLVNIRKRHAFWSLNEDILKITILKTNTPYPSRKIRRIRVCTHQRPQRSKAQYAVSRKNQYAVFKK